MLPGKAENLRNVICSCHGCVIPGGVHQMYPAKSENLSSLAISCFASQKVFSYYIRKT